VTHVPGDPERPFDQTQVLEKFRRVVAPVFGAEQAKTLPGRIAQGLDDRPSLARLVDEVSRICDGAGV
jgi:hypothetical protein